MSLVPNTYTDSTETRTHLLVNLYDSAQLEMDIVKWAIVVKDKVNAYIGRTTTLSDLDTDNKAIVSAASQLTAAYIEANPQEKLPVLTEEAKKDSDEAYAMLDVWMNWNDVKPALSARAVVATLPFVRPESGTYDA